MNEFEFYCSHCEFYHLKGKCNECNYCVGFRGEKNENTD